MALVWVLINWGRRGGFIYTAVSPIREKLDDGEISIKMWFVCVYIFDLILLRVFWTCQEYCPGCLYNDIHVFRTGCRFQQIFLSNDGTFSGTKKFFLFLSSFATILQIGDAISSKHFFCYVDDRVTPDDQFRIWSTRLLVFWQTPKVCITCFAVFLSFFSLLKMILDTFWLTRNARAISWAMTGLGAAQLDMQRAKQVLQTEQNKLQQCERITQNRIDNRTFLQKVASGLGMKQYSKDNINKRNVGKAHQQVCYSHARAFICVFICSK